MVKTPALCGKVTDSQINITVEVKNLHNFRITVSLVVHYRIF